MYVHYQHYIWASRACTLSNWKICKSTFARVFNCEGENIIKFHHFHMEGDCVCTLPACPTACLLYCMQSIKTLQFPNIVGLLNIFYYTISRMDTLIVWMDILSYDGSRVRMEHIWVSFTVGFVMKIVRTRVSSKMKQQPSTLEESGSEYFSLHAWILDSSLVARLSYWGRFTLLLIWS